MVKTTTIDQTHYTTAQAAERLGKTTGRIRQMARAGHLEGASVFGTGYIIPRPVIDALAKTAAKSNGSASAAPAVAKERATKPPRKSSKKPASKHRRKSAAKRVSRGKSRRPKPR